MEFENFTITGGSASDNITTGDGDDIIDPGSGTSDGSYYNIIHAGGGNDLMFSGDTPNPQHGFDGNKFDGGDGIDTVDYGAAPGAVFGSFVVDGTARTFNNSNGYGGTDLFSDTPGAATVENVLLSAFNDIFIGDDNNNLFDGRGGDDNLRGGLGADTLIGGDDNDTLEGGFGNDTIDGGAGTGDWASYENASGAVTVDLTLSDDEASGADGTDDLDNIENLRGGVGTDTLTGDGNDNELEGRGGGDTLTGGTGGDTVTGGTGLEFRQRRRRRRRTGCSRRRCGLG